MARFKPQDGWGFQPIPEGIEHRYELTHNFPEFVGVKARKNDTVNAKYQYPKVYLMMTDNEEYIAKSKFEYEGGYDEYELLPDEVKVKHHYFFIQQEAMDDFSRLNDLEPDTKEYEEWMAKWKDIDFYKECYGRPALFQERNLLKNTTWIPDEWFPVIGREGSVDFTLGMDSPFTLWGDSIEGSWQTIDSASGWGSLGQRKHPKKLNTDKKLKNWETWTNDYLIKNAICSNGRMYISHEQRSGYNKMDDTWKTHFYPFLYMFDFSTLKPMGKLKGILSEWSYQSEGHYGYGQTRTSRSLRWRMEYEDIEIPVKADERFESKQGWTSKGEDRIATVNPYRDSEHRDFIRTYKCWSRAKTANYNEVKGFQVDVNTTPFGATHYMADKIVDPLYRDLIKVWVPKKPLDYSMYQTGIVNVIPPISSRNEWDNVRK